jgi:alkanesulfonate monooxygenase SsuD/methylene tetrahydromethanopterin reductase-like flavin-dependent oxidoreductase (luciferase family)
VVDVGVCILPEQLDVAPWVRAEQLGFAHAWTYDHLAWRSLRDSQWFAAVPLLSAAAGATSRIRIGPLVASPNFRHPVPFAKDLVALDHLSGGRLIVGIGRGGPGWDLAMLGGPAPSERVRTERFEEFVVVLDGCMRNERYSHTGRYYSAAEARAIPPSHAPLAIAATGARGMRLAARYGACWVTVGPDVRAQVAQFNAACTAVGRDPATIRRLVLTGPVLPSGCGSPQEFDDMIGAYAELGITDVVVHWPRATEPYAGDLAVFERIFTR